VSPIRRSQLEILLVSLFEIIFFVCIIDSVNEPMLQCVRENMQLNIFQVISVNNILDVTAQNQTVDVFLGIYKVNATNRVPVPIYCSTCSINLRIQKHTNLVDLLFSLRMVYLIRG
jgi:hypothetical protein